MSHHHGFCTHGEVGHPVQLEAELPHLVYYSLHGHQQVVSLGRQSSEALFCVHIISVRSNGRASRRIEKLLPEWFWRWLGSLPVQKIWKAQAIHPAVHAELPWSLPGPGPAQLSHFLICVLKLGPEFHRGTDHWFFPRHPGGCIQGWSCERHCSALLEYKVSSTSRLSGKRRVWPSYLASMCSMRPGSCYVHYLEDGLVGRPAVVMSLWWTQVQRPIYFQLWCINCLWWFSDLSIALKCSILENPGTSSSAGTECI